MPKRERYLFVCQNERAPDNPKGCCKLRDSREIRNQLKVGMVKRGMHKRVRILESSCLDLCWMAPAIAVMPDGVFYGKVSAEDVPEILDSLENGTLVDRLIVPDELFDDPAQPRVEKPRVERPGVEKPGAEKPGAEKKEEG